MAWSTTQEPLGIGMELIFTQNANKTFNLKATVTDEENGEPVAGLALTYSVTVNDQVIELGKATTNTLGVAELKDAKLDELRKMGHSFSCAVSFAGNSDFLENEARVEIKDATLTITHEVVDSVNTVYATLSTWDENNEVMPVEEAEVKLYVPRLFSLLPVADITIEEGGEGEIEFPSDIPGGKNGELRILARLEEHEEFGNIESSIQTTWGTKQIQDAQSKRALWSPDAPLWMVITFTILMTVVWAHYYLIVYYLFRIKKLGKEQV